MKKLLTSGIVLLLLVLGVVTAVNSGSSGDEMAYLPYVVGGEEPEPTPTPVPTNIPTPIPAVTEMVIFSLDREVTKADRGFPREQPPSVNGDFTSPVNYAEGTIYVRYEVIKQKVPQNDMRLQFCLWQEKNGNNFGLETCVWTRNVPGTSGTIVCWSQDVEDMFKKGGKPLEWDRERYRVAIPIKNGAGKPVSDFANFNWSGEDPDEWYPLDLKATIVIVAKGATFSGWENYGGGC